MKYEIKTYTPLHIGTGNKYSKAEYTLKNDILHRVSLDKLLAFLNTIEIKEFTQDLENPSFRLYDFIKNKGIDIKKIKRYTAELKSRTPRDIVEQIKVNDMPYVPGSSIKGAIRTAILYKLFSSKDFNSINDLLRIGNPRVRNQKLDLYFQNKLSNQNKKNLANYSIMKFIQITDTNTINSRRRCLLVYCTKTLEVFERGSCEWYSRYGRDVEVYLETIPENTILNGSFCFQNEISKTDLTQKLGISNKKNILDINYLKECCYEFTRDLIEHEIEFAKTYKIDFLKNFYNKLKGLNTKQNPYLKLGHGSGFLAMTMGLKIKKEDPQLYEKVRKKTRGRSSSFEFPKTRKIVLDKKNKPISPIGWVCIKF